jgi:hypothetical protein
LNKGCLWSQVLGNRSGEASRSGTPLTCVVRGNHHVVARVPQAASQDWLALYHTPVTTHHRHISVLCLSFWTSWRQRSLKGNNSFCLE